MKYILYHIYCLASALKHRTANRLQSSISASSGSICIKSFRLILIFFPLALGTTCSHNFRIFHVFAIERYTDIGVTIVCLKSKFFLISSSWTIDSFVLKPIFDFKQTFTEFLAKKEARTQENRRICTLTTKLIVIYDLRHCFDRF